MSRDIGGGLVNLISRATALRSPRTGTPARTSDWNATPRRSSSATSNYLSLTSSGSAASAMRSKYRIAVHERCVNSLGKPSIARALPRTVGMVHERPPRPATPSLLPSSSSALWPPPALKRRAASTRLERWRQMLSAIRTRTPVNTAAEVATSTVTAQNEITRSIGVLMSSARLKAATSPHCVRIKAWVGFELTSTAPSSTDDTNRNTTKPTVNVAIELGSSAEFVGIRLPKPRLLAGF